MASHHIIWLFMMIILLVFTYNPFPLGLADFVDVQDRVMKQFAAMVSPTPQGWNTSNHYCTWPGISCRPRSKAVDGIYLTGLSLSGNSHLTQSHAIAKPPWKLLIILLGASIIILLSIIWILVQHKKRKNLIKLQKEDEKLENSLLLLPNSPTRFTYEELKVATSSFDMQQRLGVGGFGSVFEGTLVNGIKIAVKRLDRLSHGKKEFLAEVRAIGGTQHVNLIKLVGFCAEKTYRLLVYEYMSNGSLDKWIFHKSSGANLAWYCRKKIIVQIAKGLAYLHEECIKRIAHLDVKPQNVLLDEDMNAKISDFGLAKLIDREQSHVVTQLRGTRGYLAPEWLDRKITEKADVYSYGVMVLEVVFERKNLDDSLPPCEEDDNRLIYLVRKKAEANQLYDSIDACDQDMQQHRQDVEKIIKLALWCLHTDPRKRPSMSMIVSLLEDKGNMDIIRDSDLFPSTVEGSNTANSITQLSDCPLSGPR